MAASRGRRMSSIAFLTCLLGACAGMLGPDEDAPPRADLSSDPAHLVDPLPLYNPCQDIWLHGAPPAEPRVLVDVSFRRSHPEDEFRHPTIHDLKTIWKYDGVIMYQFHVPVVRAWIATTDIPSLAREPAVTAIFIVSNPRRYDWRVDVGFRSQEAYESGARRFVSLGGQVHSKANVIKAIAGLLPDRSIPAFRLDKRVEYVVDVSGYFPCFFPARGPS